MFLQQWGAIVLKCWEIFRAEMIEVKSYGTPTHSEQEQRTMLPSIAINSDLTPTEQEQPVPI